MFLLLAVFKLGFLANFLSKPILVGFVGGLALDIMVSQIAKMLGVKIDSGAEFVDKVVALVTGLPSLNGWSVLLAAVSVAVLLVGQRYLRAVPWALIVLVATTVVVVLTGLDGRGVDVLGEVPAGPPALTWPVIDWSLWLALIPSAIALTLVTTAEGLLVSRSYSEKHRYPFHANRDLLAFGVANVAAGAQGSFAVGSSTSRTAAMDQAGSRTQLPALVLAVGTLLLLLFGTALLADIPSPAIGAIVGVAIIPLLGIRDFIRLWRLDRFEFVIGAVCFLVTLFVGSIAESSWPSCSPSSISRNAPPIRRSTCWRPRATPGIPVGGCSRRHDHRTGVIVVRLAAPLFFANGAVFSAAVKDAVRTAGPTAVQHVVIDMEAVTDVDVTGAEAFQALREWLDTQSISLAFSRVRPNTLRRLRTLGLLDRETVYATNRAAITDLSPTDAASSAPHRKGS